MYQELKRSRYIFLLNCIYKKQPNANIQNKAI